MNTIRRKSAIIIFAIYKIALLSNSEIEDILFSDYLDEETGEPIVYEDIYDSDIQDFLLNFHVDVVFYGISNEYLFNFLEK
ncbi:hypothetical protein NWI45_003798, partial [Salmonella enterica subsp. enterica serovar Meleagridis]|nr:hypothetical protein [Salmonella enterica subsp. enterica serovar Meleagridis]